MAGMEGAWIRAGRDALRTPRGYGQPPRAPPRQSHGLAASPAPAPVQRHQVRMRAFERARSASTGRSSRGARSARSGQPFSIVRVTAHDRLAAPDCSAASPRHSVTVVAADRRRRGRVHDVGHLDPPQADRLRQPGRAARAMASSVSPLMHPSAVELLRAAFAGQRLERVDAEAPLCAGRAPQPGRAADVGDPRTDRQRSRHLAA